VVAFQVIGKPTPRVDGVDKVSGRALYTADVSLPGTLWGKTLHSPYPHARIVRIDTTAARRLPGVHAVLTGADVDGGLYGRIIKDVPVLARERVRFFGERVAAVAADDEDIAEQALALIEIDYEELAAVFDPFEALAAGAPILHPKFASYAGGSAQESPSNAYAFTKTERGDLDAGFTAADVIVENTYTTSRVHQAYLEPHNVLVSLEGERVQVWACSKAPYSLREALAAAVGIPESAIVVNHSDIGGDFGGKATPADLPIAYYLAKATGRPVRMISEYLEEFMAANPRHATVIRLKTGVKRDGSLTAHQVEFFVNCGAYAGFKPRGVIGGANQAVGPYMVANTRIESTHVYTNTVPGGHMRAPGEPQGVFAIESHVDEIARRLAIDPVALRLQNLVSEGQETALGERLNDLHGQETLRRAAQAAGYYDPKPAFVGRGVAIGDRGPGGGEGSAAVTLKADGSITLGTPIFDQGSGTYTTLCQVVAEELQVTPERVAIDVWNTDAVDFDSGIGGMRASRVNTIVSYEAAQDAKRALFHRAAERLGWPEEALILRGAEVRRTDQEETIPWTDLLGQTGEPVTGRAHVDERARPHLTSFTAQVAEVAVDPETGAIELRRFTTAHDVGRILNPVGHQGQINGGFLQGLGYATMEELRVEEGRVTNLSFGDYKIPTIRDLPPLETVLLESESGVGPYQIKGIGESPIAPVAPAIANAIADAIGVRIRDLPLTAEKIYRAAKDAR